MKSLRRSFLGKLTLASLIAASPLAVQSARAQSIEAMATASPNDWPQYHRTGAAWRFSPLTQIN